MKSWKKRARIYKYKLKHELSVRTHKIRHLLVKLLAPTLYKGASTQATSLTRPMIEFIRKNFGGKPLTGVEIGVLHGKNAERILKTLSIQKLYLIDPYELYIEVSGELSDTRNALQECKKRVSKSGEKVKFIIKKSSEAVNEIPDDLDFVYIDGNHAYEFVKKDIELYYPKIKTGGVLGGHDFALSTKGVFKAVMEFVTDNELKLHGEDTDWWVVKK